MSKAVKSAGLQGHADVFSPELLAALAGGFQRMLAEQAPAASASKAENNFEAFVPNTSKVKLPKNASSMTRETAYMLTEIRPILNTSTEERAAGATGTGLPTNPSTVRAEANGGKTTSGPKIQRIRPADIAFPSANSFLDHSPNAPFELDAHELANTAVPANQCYAERLHEVDDAGELCNRLKMQSKKAPHTEGSVSATCMMEVGLHRAVTAFAICDPETRRFLRAHPLFKTLLHAEPHTSQFAFHIAEVPGRGKGLVASRLIKAGECILREPPLLVTMQGLQPRTVACFHQALEQNMHYRARIALDSLDNCHETVPGISPRLGILRTNAIGIDFPTSKDLLCGVFELISRLNHSCDPNVGFRWSYKDLQGSIWAVKEIKPGEELLFSYVNPKAPKKTRRDELLKKHKVFCTCTKCGPA